MPNQDVIELRWIFIVIRRWLWLILGCSFLAAVIAYLVTSWIPPMYYATVTLLIEPARDSRTSESNILVAGERRAFTYSQMVKGQPVLAEVISRLGLDETPGKLAKRIEAESIPDTQLMRMTVMDSSPTQVVTLANTIAETFTEHIRKLQDQRYAGSLTSTQEEMDALSAQIGEIQSEIDDLNANKFESEAEQARLESLLGRYLSDYRVLETDSLELQLTMAQMMEEVNIVEAAHVPEDQVLPPYTATVTLILARGELALTYGQMLAGIPVLEATIAQLELEESPNALANKVTVEPILGTQLIQLSVVDSDASQAALLADTIAENFASQVRALLVEPYTDSMATIEARMDILSALTKQIQTDIEMLSAENVHTRTDLARLESLLAEYRSNYRTIQEDYEQLRLTGAQAADAVVIAESAQVPEISAQRSTLYTAIAALLGAMVGLAIAFTLESMNNTIRTPDDVTQILDTGTLSTIGRLDNGYDELIVVAQPRSPVAEAFSMLGTNIRLSSVNDPLKTLLVTSPTNTEGKSLVVANLAVSLARTGLIVVAVDADLRLPRLHKLFGLDQGEGFADYLLKGNTDGNLQPTQVEGLSVLTSGAIPDNPAELLGSPHLIKLLNELGKEADLVLIDSPPVLPVADTVILASVADGVLLVLRAGHTSSQAALDTMKSLRQVNAHLIGVVLNNAADQGNSYYRYYVKENGEGTNRLQAMVENFKKKYRA